MKADETFAAVANDPKAINKAELATRRYLDSRVDFIESADSSNLLFGNDNLVGRVAEFYAIRHFLQQGFHVSRAVNKSFKGVDLKVKQGSEELLVSVKCITSENKRKTTSEVTEPLDGFTDNFLVVVVWIGNAGEYSVIEVQGHDWANDPRKKKTVNRTICPQLRRLISSNVDSS